MWGVSLANLVPVSPVVPADFASYLVCARSFIMYTSIHSVYVHLVNIRPFILHTLFLSRIPHRAGLYTSYTLHPPTLMPRVRSRVSNEGGVRSHSRATLDVYPECVCAVGIGFVLLGAHQVVRTKQHKVLEGLLAPDPVAANLPQSPDFASYQVCL